jgi:hypothetical protein
MRPLPTPQTFRARQFVLNLRPLVCAMKKRKFILAGLMVVIVSAVVLVCFLSSNDHVRVIGELFPGDLADVKKAIHREIWRGTLPDYSWKSIKNFPRIVISNETSHVLSIELKSNITFHMTSPAGGNKARLIFVGPYIYIRAIISPGHLGNTNYPAHYEIILQQRDHEWNPVFVFTTD